MPSNSHVTTSTRPARDSFSLSVAEREGLWFKVHIMSRLFTKKMSILLLSVTVLTFDCPKPLPKPIALICSREHTE